MKEVFMKKLMFLTFFLCSIDSFICSMSDDAISWSLFRNDISGYVEPYIIDNNNPDRIVDLLEWGYKINIDESLLKMEERLKKLQAEREQLNFEAVSSLKFVHQEILKTQCIIQILRKINDYKKYYFKYQLIELLLHDSLDLNDVQAVLNAGALIDDEIEEIISKKIKKLEAEKEILENKEIIFCLEEIEDQLNVLKYIQDVLLKNYYLKQKFFENFNQSFDYQNVKVLLEQGLKVDNEMLNLVIDKFNVLIDKCNNLLFDGKEVIEQDLIKLHELENIINLLRENNNCLC
ncbi:hypothetical protein GF322_02540 [Candidatus Dependentiae bacterium]|nr:hypothetical protein [Candidatus Dependentiae bacterium]